MKKFLLVLAAGLLLSGCGYHDLMSKIPNTAFDRFEYHRGGNFSSAHITAIDAIKVDGSVYVGKATLTSDYGPFVNFTILLEGLELEDIQND